MKIAIRNALLLTVVLLLAAPGKADEVDSRPFSAEEMADEPGGVVNLAGEPIIDADGNWVVPDGESPTLSTEQWFQSGRFYIQNDLVLMHRSRARGTRVAIDRFSGRPLDTDNPGFELAPGIRATFGAYLGRDFINRDHSVEFTYFGVEKFNIDDSLSSQQSNGVFFTPDINVAGFNGVDTIGFEYESRLYGFELNTRIRRRLGRDRVIMGPDGNWTRQITSGVTPSLLFGVRMVSVLEKFELEARRIGVDPGVFGGDVRIDTHNDLLGVQIGGDCIDQHDHWYWGVRGKLGAYANFSDQNTVVFAANPTSPAFDRDETASEGRPSFVGEFSVLAAYHVTPDFTLRTSYDVMGVTGLALASDQLSFEPRSVAQINTGGGILYQSISLGFEYIW